MRKARWYAAVLAVLCAPAQAVDFELGDFEGAWKNVVSVGAAMRMQNRSDELLGKLNVPGQQDLCRADDCVSLEGDPAPNQRLVDARGAFFGHNGDNGNLNYDRYDIVAATTKLNTDLTIRNGEWLARLHAVGYFDPVNAGFMETHNDTEYQPRHTRRNGEVQDLYAAGINLYDAYLQYGFTWGERSGAITVGSQVVRWGESTLVALNSISEINPPDANFLRMPGGEFNEIFQPVPAVVISTDLFEGVSMELFYQLLWRPVIPDASGSFFSDSDIVGGGSEAVISLGQFGEDPDRQRVFHNSTVRALSSTTTSVNVREEDPSDSGQYGLRLNYFADWLNDGTELGLYFLNYHSRLPYGSLHATDDSCARDSLTVAAALVDCKGFNGDLPNPLYGQGLEPLPIDTLDVFLQYPEDIQMVGISFNTNIGSWSLAGEYSFRPNLPLQVQLADLVLGGVQPAFPANQLAILQTPAGVNDIETLTQLIQQAVQGGTAVNPAAIPGLLLALPGLLNDVLPAAEDAVPSFVVRYRGIDRVGANQYLRGWERLHVGQFDFTAIRAVSDTLGADQIIFIGEVGGTQVFDMPSKRELQFETFYPNATTASPGQDGSGQPNGQPPPSATLVPTQQRKGFADDFAWGLRSLIRMEYNDVIFGWNFKPSFVLTWDVHGTAPFPIQNFVEGRKEFAAGTDINFTQELTGRVLYGWFTGAGEANTRRDRDYMAMSVSYAF
ncbi:DUF1302 domain-containing protein [Solimonas sp. K1W22B-7]|uniref:DUF1302 domain-containing protein n=1 Tax=Solimonas sp. K1W22B-7 TaxID=2303331 RepID=UPI0013C4CA1A|nr:DUF1302 family protein [Solimonas sp. K1W22B-7]